MRKKENLLARNILFNFVGLLLMIWGYTTYKHDESLTGWYYTIGTIPMLLIPTFNYAVLIIFLRKIENKNMQILLFLTFPSLILIGYITSEELRMPIVLLWLFSLTIVNMTTYYFYRSR